MLDGQVLEKLNFECFKSCVRVDTNHCLKYVCRDSATDKNVILTAQLPYECGVFVFGAVLSRKL